MELIDTHCHLTALTEEELFTVIREALEAQVKRFICIGAGDGVNSAHVALQLASKHRGIFATVGIHPHDAKITTDAHSLLPQAQNPRVLAIGETGLDFFRDWSPVDAQFELFRNTIRLAKLVGKPLVIHCRDAQDDTMKVLREEGAESVGGVFHCYAGDAALAQELREMNFLVSFTGNVTFKKAISIQEAAKNIPLDQIMVETDMPYMAPEPFRGGPSAPKHVAIVAKKIADLKGVTLEAVIEATTENALRLFRIPQNERLA